MDRVIHNPDHKNIPTAPTMISFNELQLNLAQIETLTKSDTFNYLQCSQVYYLIDCHMSEIKNHIYIQLSYQTHCKQGLQHSKYLHHH